MLTTIPTVDEASVAASGATIKVDWADFDGWFGRVVDQDGRELHNTGPCFSAKIARQCAEAWVDEI